MRKNSSSGSHWLSSTMVTLTCRHHHHHHHHLHHHHHNIGSNIFNSSHLLLLLVRLKSQGFVDGDVILSLICRTVDCLHPVYNHDGEAPLVTMQEERRIQDENKKKLDLNCQFQKCTTLLLPASNLTRASSHAEHFVISALTKKTQILRE